MSEVIDLSQEGHIGEQLRSGGFGRVHLARSEFGETVVIKFVPKAPGADREIRMRGIELHDLL